MFENIKTVLAEPQRAIRGHLRRLRKDVMDADTGVRKEKSGKEGYSAVECTNVDMCCLSMNRPIGQMENYIYT